MSDHLEIRPVRDRELAAAGEATAGAYREFVRGANWEAYLERIADVAGRYGHTTVLVAALGGVVTGTATLELDARTNPGSAEPLAPDEAHLRMLGVSPEHRGLGIGRQLVEACIDLARQRGKRRLTLDTTSVMRVAQRLYTAMGFVCLGEHESDQGVVLIRYSLDIAPGATASS